ncbi:MAG: hypothetical protein R2798_05510 [Chitinophagales bacterium]
MGGYRTPKSQGTTKKERAYWQRQIDHALRKQKITKPSQLEKMKVKTIKKHFLNKNRAEIEKYLGKPQEALIDEIDDEYLRLFYYNPYIMVVLSKKDGEFIFYSIHLNKILFGKIAIEENITTKGELLKKIQKIHTKKQIMLEYHYSEDVIDTMIEFPNINLTVWIENNTVSDICYRY